MIEIEIAGPGKNALGSELMRSLLDQLRAAGGAPLLLRGAGDAFSAGLNLKEVVSLDSKEMEAFLRLLVELTTTLFEYPGPTVALVEGHAIAGGCIVALCCDYKVGANNPKARIGLNEVGLGLRFPPRLLKLLRYVVPRLEPVILHAGLYGPEQARSLGLLDEVVEDAEARAKAYLAELAKHPAEAYAVAKRDLRAGATDVDEADERAFVAEVVPTWTSDALRARINELLGR